MKEVHEYTFLYICTLCCVNLNTAQDTLTSLCFILYFIVSIIHEKRLYCKGKKKSKNNIHPTYCRSQQNP